MSAIMVGIADCQLTNAPGQTLITYALGSCIAVAIHDPIARVGGMLHYMLPESGLDPPKAQANPYMFADTGIPLLFRRAYELGAEKRRLVVSIAGGAQVLDEGGYFNIGKRNCLALRRILWKAGVLIHAEAVGGACSRTLRLHVDTGQVWLRTEGRPEFEMAVTQPQGGGGCACAF